MMQIVTVLGRIAVICAGARVLWWMAEVGAIAASLGP